MMEGGVKEGDALDFGKFGFAMADYFQCGKIVSFRRVWSVRAREPGILRVDLGIEHELLRSGYIGLQWRKVLK